MQCAATLSRRERKKQRKKARDKFQLSPVESRINLNLSADAGYQFVFYLLTVRINYASSPAAYVAVAASSSSNGNSTSNNNDYTNNRAGDLLSPCNVVAGRWLNSSADTVATSSSSSSSSSLSSELLLRLELATVRNQASAVQFHQTTFTHSFTFTAMTTVTNFFDSFSTLIPHCSLSRAPVLWLTFVAQVFCYDFVALAHSSTGWEQQQWEPRQPYWMHCHFTRLSTV